MPIDPAGRDVSSAAAPSFVLDRRQAVPTLTGRHQDFLVDLEKIAAASGIKRTLAIERESELAAGARLIREGSSASFVLLRVKADGAARLQARSQPRHLSHPLPCQQRAGGPTTSDSPRRSPPICI